MRARGEDEETGGPVALLGRSDLPSPLLPMSPVFPAMKACTFTRGKPLYPAAEGTSSIQVAADPSLPSSTHRADEHGRSKTNPLIYRIDNLSKHLNSADPHHRDPQACKYRTRTPG